MKNQKRSARTLGSLIALTGVVLVAAMVNGCVAGSDEGTDEGVGVSHAAIVPVGCECGAWSCSKTKVGGNAVDFTYAVPGCGLPNQPTAHTTCTTKCAVACTDSGFDSTC